MSFFFSSRRRHTRFDCDWSSDVCSSDLNVQDDLAALTSVVFARKVVVGAQTEPKREKGRGGCDYKEDLLEQAVFVLAQRPRQQDGKRERKNERQSPGK